MGYNTWLTLKKPLPNRLNIVLSRKADIEPHESVVVARDVDLVLAVAKELKGDLFVIGGEQVYRSFLPYIEKWFVTEVPLEVEGADTFVPDNYLEGFERMGTKTLEDELTVTTYERA
jgi:dihydrofolate reductase